MAMLDTPILLICVISCYCNHNLWFLDFFSFFFFLLSVLLFPLKSDLKFGSNDKIMKLINWIFWAQAHIRIGVLKHYNTK